MRSLIYCNSDNCNVIFIDPNLNLFKFYAIDVSQALREDEKK